MRVLEHPRHNFGHCFQSYAAPASAFSSRNEPLHEKGPLLAPSSGPCPGNMPLRRY
jgi:hypothetical protein